MIYRWTCRSCYTHFRVAGNIKPETAEQKLLEAGWKLYRQHYEDQYWRFWFGISRRSVPTWQEWECPACYEKRTAKPPVKTLAEMTTQERVAMMSAMMGPVKPMFADFDVNQVQLSLEFRRVKARPSDELIARARAIILEQAERELFSMFALPAEALQMTSDRGGSYVTAQAMREQIERMRGLRAREKTAPFDGLSHDEAMKRLAAACGLDVAAG